MKSRNQKNNVINFPTSMSESEREIEAILFAAEEPLDIESIESKIKKNIAATIANKTTITAPVSVSFPVGQETLKASFLTP